MLRQGSEGDGEESLVDQGAVLDKAWPMKHNLGTKAFNDAMLLQCAIHILLQKHFTDDP